MKKLLYMRHHRLMIRCICILTGGISAAYAIYQVENLQDSYIRHPLALFGFIWVSLIIFSLFQNMTKETEKNRFLYEGNVLTDILRAPRQRPVSILKQVEQNRSELCAQVRKNNVEVSSSERSPIRLLPTKYVLSS